MGGLATRGHLNSFKRSLARRCIAKGITNEVSYLITSQVLLKELLITINLFGFSLWFGFTLLQSYVRLGC